MPSGRGTTAVTDDHDDVASVAETILHNPWPGSAVSKLLAWRVGSPAPSAVVAAERVSSPQFVSRLCGGGITVVLLACVAKAVPSADNGVAFHPCWGLDLRCKAGVEQALLFTHRVSRRSSPGRR